jgi:hypothetical protein
MSDKSTQQKELEALPASLRDAIVASIKEREARGPFVAAANGALKAAIDSLTLSMERGHEEASASRAHAVSLDTTRIRLESGKARVLIQEVMAGCGVEGSGVDVSVRAVEGGL